MFFHDLTHQDAKLRLLTMPVSSSLNDSCRLNLASKVMHSRDASEVTVHRHSVQGLVL